MHWTLFLVAAAATSLLFYPLYRYFWRLIWRNGDEFAPAFKKDFGKDLEQEILTKGRGLTDQVADRFVYASLAVFIVPFIPHALCATGLYFLLQFLFG